MCIALAVSVATAIGALATAVISYMLLLLQRPVVTIEREYAGGHHDVFRVVVHGSAPDAPPRWLLLGARVRGKRWRRWLAPVRVVPPPRVVGPAAFAPKGEWQRRLRFDPPVPQGQIAIHPDAPLRGSLALRICSSSSTRLRATATVRYAKKQ